MSHDMRDAAFVQERISKERKYGQLRLQWDPSLQRGEVILGTHCGESTVANFGPREWEVITRNPPGPVRDVYDVEIVFLKAFPYVEVEVPA